MLASYGNMRRHVSVCYANWVKYAANERNRVSASCEPCSVNEKTCTKRRRETAARHTPANSVKVILPMIVSAARKHVRPAVPGLPRSVSK